MTSSLTKPLTTDEVKGSIYNIVAATGTTSSNWKPGAVTRTLIAGVSLVLAGLSAFMVLAVEQIFLPFATGEWLRLVALYVFNVVREEATFATGPLKLTNASGSTYAWAEGQLVVRNPVTHKTYVNLTPITLLASSSLTVTIAATEIGGASNSYTGEITEVVSALAGVSCANAEPVLGKDVEGPATLRARCMAKLEPVSPNGPADAYRYIARSARRADGSSIGVTRVRALPIDKDGKLSVYLAGSAGEVAASDVAIIDDLFQRKCVPLCVTCTTASASVVSVPIKGSVWLYNTSGMTVTDIQSAIEAELVAYFAAMPIGGGVIDVAGAVYKSELESVIGRARKADSSPLRIIKVQLDSPSDDLPLAADAICELGAVDLRVHQISAVGI